jgi:predicted glycoside hydrolase/deacetylase ChbG (UPF0249 family)
MRLVASISSAVVLAMILLVAEMADAQEPQAGPAAVRPRLIIRLDDIGFCHSANMADEGILKEGVCSSMSVIVNTPWLDEAAKILGRHPEISVGVHLTLNAEWREPGRAGSARHGPLRANLLPMSRAIMGLRSATTAAESKVRLRSPPVRNQL